MTWRIPKPYYSARRRVLHRRVSSMTRRPAAASKPSTPSSRAFARSTRLCARRRRASWPSASAGSEDPAAAMAELKKENLALQQERDWLLESNDIDPDDLSAAPLCPRCGGTGYVGAVMCDCLRELCRQEQKKELSQLLGSGKESFEHFRLDLYPAEYDPKLGASPRKLMQYVYNNALHYARTFTLESGSILMIGATGLGKTFLSACIARTVADRGYSVLYSTAMQLFSDFETAKFARSTESADASRKYFTCDLLIIDDLGTEMTTQFTVSALYQIVNTRLLEGRPTIIPPIFPPRS